MAKMNVLLVDDEQEFVEALSERLQMRDLENETAYDGEEALRFVDDKEPDVMVLDLKMPGIDGIEVLRRVKKKYPDIRVIILTGHGTDRDEDEARRIGIFEYLSKPVEIEQLVKCIREAYQDKIRTTMAAAAFAEAGEPEMARNFLDQKGK